jgi:drug/metabolite transporter (DMT)-like permease
MRKAFLQLHIAVFLAGFTGILGRLINLQEGLLVAWRLLLSAITLWVLYWLTHKIQRISPRDILKITLTGGLAAIHWVCFFGSVKYANISVALVCFSGIGFFTALFEPLVLRRRLVVIELLLGLLVMLGIFLIFHFDPQYKKGILFGLVSAITGALFPIFNHQFMQRMNAPTLITWELSGGFLSLVILLPFYFSAFPPAYWWPTPTDWIWLLVLSWACSVWAFQLSANALKKISAFTVNLMYNLEPVYGIVLAFLVYQENKMLGPSFYAGLSLIVLAVALQSWRVYRKRSIH